MSDLKPCPFCKSQDVNIIQSCAPLSICQNCGATGPTAGTYSEAVRLWNQRAGDWQPIETAPKDGTRVLGFYPDTEKSYKDTSYIERLGTWTLAYGKTPTHWMPLPEAPTDNQSAEADHGKL